MSTGALTLVPGSKVKQVHGCSVSALIASLDVGELFGVIGLELAITG